MGNFSTGVCMTKQRQINIRSSPGPTDCIKKRRRATNVCSCGYLKKKHGYRKKEGLQTLVQMVEYNGAGITSNMFWAE
eukprot:1150480-Pelagomonas_calceolata.AAC.1